MSKHKSRILLLTVVVAGWLFYAFFDLVTASLVSFTMAAGVLALVACGLGVAVFFTI
jgi:hypothetical protein